MADADCLHLARHCAARARVLRALLQRLATIPETVELARATGLTLGNILYNAQMIRTWSLLLRNAQRRGWVGAGRLLLRAAAIRQSNLLLEWELSALALSPLWGVLRVSAAWLLSAALASACTNLAGLLFKQQPMSLLHADHAAVLATTKFLPSAQQVACSQATLPDCFALQLS